MQREGVFREMKRRKGKTVRAQDPREGRSHPTRTQGRQETGPARRPDPHAQTAGACAPSGAAAQVLSLLRTRSCAARSADVESRTECAAPVCGKRTKNAPAFRRCRIAISEKGTMTDESPRTKPEELPKTKTELEALVLAELRAAPHCARSFLMTTIALAPPGRWPIVIQAHPRRKRVSARCATSFVACSSISILHQPKEIIQWQRQHDKGARP